MNPLHTVEKKKTIAEPMLASGSTFLNSTLSGLFSLIGGKTAMNQRFHQAPLKISKTHFMTDADQLYVCIMDASPGLMNGDCYSVEMTLEPQTRVYLTNQSFTRVHPTPSTPAVMRHFFQVKENALFEFFPEPLIPYVRSRSFFSTKVYLEPGASFLYSDILTPGRVHHDELFAYDSLSSRLEVMRCGKRAAWDHFYLEPGHHHFREASALENHTHLASLWIFNDRIDETLLIRIREELKQHGNITAGVSLSADQDVCIRMLGSSTWQLQAAVSELRSIAHQHLFAKPPSTIRK